MKENKKMPISLKNKMKQNEEKFQIILNKKNPKKSKIEEFEDNKENKSEIINKKEKIIHEKGRLTELLDDSFSISTRNKKSFFIKNKNKENKELKNTTKNNKYTNRNNNPLRNIKNKEFLKLNNNNSKTINNYNSKNIKNNYYYNYNDKNKEPTYEIIKYKRNTVDVNNNINSNKYNESYIMYTNPLDNSVKAAFNLNNMLERFEEDEIKKKEKIEKLIKEKENKEKCYYTYKPKICKKTKYLNNKIKDDFLTRQKKYKDIKSKNEKILKEKLLKNEEEKINKNNFLLQKKNKDHSSVGNTALNTSFISDISVGQRSMAEIDSNITRLYEWDNKRKEKIKKMQKEKSNEIEKNKHIPRINKKSKNMVNRNRIKNKKENIFIRLSKEDDFVVEKKRILAELLSPTFKPNINLTFRRFDDDVFEEKKKKKSKI